MNKPKSSSGPVGNYSTTGITRKSCWYEAEIIFSRTNTINTWKNKQKDTAKTNTHTQNTLTKGDWIMKCATYANMNIECAVCMPSSQPSQIIRCWEEWENREVKKLTEEWDRAGEMWGKALVAVFTPSMQEPHPAVRVLSA